MPDGEINSTAFRLAAAALAESAAGGAWRAPLAAHAPLQAIALLCALPAPPRDQLDRTAEALLARLEPNGAFALFPGGPPDAGACVLAYAALKLAGLPPAGETLTRLRDQIHALGGLQVADAYTRLLLALFALYPGEHLPPLPDQSAWRRLPAWSRALLTPFFHLHARHIAASRPRPVPDGYSLAELLRADLPLSDPRPHAPSGPGAWLRRLPSWLNPGVKPAVPPPLPIGGLGLAPTPGLWLTRLAQNEPLPSSLVPAITPVRDTALALLAHPDPPPESAAWLKARRLPGSAWARQFAGELHCHTEETALALIALRGDAPPEALAWLRRQQGRRGGWAACDAHLETARLPELPFPGAFGASDPACPALTGLALEALTACGVPAADRQVQAGVHFLTQSQLARDGSWSSRWGVHYLHGACFALRGLRAAGFDDHDAVVLRAGEWIRSIQNADGGWGESPASVEQGEFLEAPSNATHTAWALLGLVAGGDPASESVRRGVEYLLASQTPEGLWPVAPATLLHAPPALFLANPLDALSFPLLALRAVREAQP